MNLQNFFKDKKGNAVIIQKPNLYIYIALFFFVISYLRSDILIAIGKWGFRITILFWAIDEILRGDSPFRRVLGFVIGLLLIFMIFRDILHF